MAKWMVPLTLYCEVEVEADTKEEAVSAAEQSVDISDCDMEVTDNMVQNLSDGVYYQLSTRK